MNPEPKFSLEVSEKSVLSKDVRLNVLSRLIKTAFLEVEIMAGHITLKD